MSIHLIKTLYKKGYKILAEASIENLFLNSQEEVV